ncbi:MULTISPECIES: hypothetical protein [Sandaracinus]|uniref:hypothetical protein n=1 Tax=Sandaracinus TaxID=1055688 RepID=UPI0019D4C2F6|nr:MULTISPECIES: hypothetical protein [Sandaracinus]QRN75790.1 Hypothetical protein MSR10575_88770 [Sandaracinus sp.]UJR87309.1 Hypothetical protein I5071_1010 [Sandaracinus amylolyticus]
MFEDDYAASAGDYFEVGGAEDYAAIAGALDWIAQEQGFASGAELLSALEGYGYGGEAFPGDGYGGEGFVGYDDEAYAGAPTVEDVLAASVGAARRRRPMPVRRLGRPVPMPMRPAARPPLAPRAISPVPMRPAVPPQRAAQAVARLASAARSPVPTRGARSRRPEDRIPLNFSSETPLTPGQLITIAVHPQVKRFEVDQLVIPSTIGNDFVCELTVGKNPQRAGSQSMTPAIVYSELSKVGTFGGQVCELGKQISIAVQNIGTADRRFIGSVFGWAEE